jgi:hypothetical protein
MGRIRIPRPVKYFASMLFPSEDVYFRAAGELRYIVGAVQEKTPLMPFKHTAYYDNEMGGDLYRYFVLFTPHLDRDLLPEIKLKTNEVEERLSHQGHRTVNIDPGYVTMENVILATTKGYSHRIYMSRGIYADLTLMYVNGTFRPLEWTYPDYASLEAISVFNGWRNIYKRELKC